MKKVRLTKEQIKEVETLAAVLSVKQIADYFGIARSTMFVLMNENEEIERNYRKGKAKAINDIAQSLIMKARDGHIASMIFFLKTQAGWRESSNLDVTNSDGTFRVQTKKEVEEDIRKLGFDPEKIKLKE